MLDRKLFLAGASALAIAASSAAAAADGGPPDNFYDATGADIQGSSTVYGNKVIDWMSRRANDIDGSFTGDGSGSTSGIVHVQQNNGSATGLEAGTAIQGGLNSHIGFVKSEAKLDLDTHDNKFVVKGYDLVPKDFDDRLNTIGNGSFDGFSGIASVQQNNGDANQIGIATSILAGNGQQEGDGYQKAEVEGTTYNQTGKGAEAKDPEWNGHPEIPPDKGPNGEPVPGTGSPAVPGVFENALVDEDSDVLNSITNVFTGAAGIFQVQQNNGNGNAIGSATAVISTDNFWGTLDGGMNVSGHSHDNGVVDINVNRENSIESSFNGSSGSTTLQQNNGHSNFMGTATSIVVGTGGPAMTGGLTDASLNNCVTNNAVQVEDNSVYNNNLTTAFNGYSGIAQIQQNNGNGNAMAQGAHVSVQGLSTSAVPSLPFGL